MATLRATGVRTRYDHLDAYGFDLKSWYNSFENHLSLDGWTEHFVSRYLSHRSKPNSGYVFEKTPQNANAIDVFLNANSNNQFVYVLRHPLFVIDSLLRRGWGPYTAAVTWLVNVALYWSFKDHPRMHLIRYEELVENPFETVTDLLKTLCPEHELKADVLEKEYRDNSYRQEHVKRINAWSTGNESIVQNANDKETSEQARDLLNAVLSTRISSIYAQSYRISQLKMTEAMDHFGYASEVPQKARFPLKSIADHRKLWAKTARYLKRGQSLKVSVAHFRALERL